MLLNWIREKTPFGLNAQMIDSDEFDIGYDSALSPETINRLSGRFINDLDIGTSEDADKIEQPLDEHELALSRFQ